MGLKTIILALTIVCVTGYKGPEDEPCEPHSEFFWYCNRCFCDEQGTASCTRMGCPPGMYNQDGTLNPTFKLSEEEKLETRSITTNVPEGCEPGSKFQYYCNTCTCKENGLEKACTKMFCVPGLHNEDGTLATIPDVSPKPVRSDEDLPELPKSGPCTPGKFYKQECNRCACLHNGDAACTQMGCFSEYKRGTKKLSFIELPSLPTDGKCEPHANYKIGCNVCACREDGLGLMCTYKNCIVSKRSNGRNPDTRNCAYGTVFPANNCFSCTCLGGGKSVCTFSGC